MDVKKLYGLTDYQLEFQELQKDRDDKEEVRNQQLQYGAQLINSVGSAAYSENLVKRKEMLAEKFNNTKVYQPKDDFTNYSSFDPRRHFTSAKNSVEYTPEFKSISDSSDIYKQGLKDNPYLLNDDGFVNEFDDGGTYFGINKYKQKDKTKKIIDSSKITDSLDSLFSKIAKPIAGVGAYLNKSDSKDATNKMPKVDMSADYSNNPIGDSADVKQITSPPPGKYDWVYDLNIMKPESIKEVVSPIAEPIGTYAQQLKKIDAPGMEEALKGFDFGSKTLDVAGTVGTAVSVGSNLAAMQDTKTFARNTESNQNITGMQTVLGGLSLIPGLQFLAPASGVLGFLKE